MGAVTSVLVCFDYGTYAIMKAWVWFTNFDLWKKIKTINILMGLGPELDYNFDFPSSASNSVQISLAQIKSLKQINLNGHLLLIQNSETIRWYKYILIVYFLSNRGLKFSMYTFA